MSALLADRNRRPRLIIWGGTALLVLVALTAISVVGTSTNWFCTGPCHVVHDDNTLTFNKGSHVMQSCVTCHEPLNGSPLTFVFMKMKVAPDMVPTVRGTYTLPMNENQAIAFEMPSEQCTQCHNLANRKITTSPDIIMDHEAHSAAGVNCTSCHNRVAHPEENVTYTLDGDLKHENWMSMDACFRCHGLEKGARAPGECAKCHPADFGLVPTTHSAPGWYAEFGESRGHAAAYSEEASRVAGAEAWAAALEPVKHKETLDIGYEQTVNTCYTCHAKQFCTNCHGVEMPHPADFAKSHGEAGRENPQACARCHARSEAEARGDAFCNACHHPQGTPGVPWVEQHFNTVKAEGAQGCFKCHDPRYCAVCHVGGAAAAQRYLQEKSGK